MMSATAPVPAWSDTAAAPKGNVSITRLRHRPPQKAIKFFLRGVKLATSGQWQNGVNEFERAAAIDPQFSEAYGNLGASLSAIGEFEQAIGHFRRAIEIDPATGAYHMNLAYALMRLDREKEAEPEARTAVSLEPANANAHYLLGVLFAQHYETRSGAIQHLQYAAREFPVAHYILSELYRLGGDAGAANQEMQQYTKESANLGKETR
jgi:Flp pilus assembly protein TadD